MDERYYKLNSLLTMFSEQEAKVYQYQLEYEQSSRPHLRIYQNYFRNGKTFAHSDVG